MNTVGFATQDRRISTSFIEPSILVSDPSEVVGIPYHIEITGKLSKLPVIKPSILVSDPSEVAGILYRPEQ